MSADTKNIQIKPSKKKGEKKVSILLENELTIFSIEKMHSKIIDAVKKYDEIEFHLKNITNMDLTFVQFFYSIRQTAQKTKKNVSIEANLSEDIKSLFENADLIKILS